MNVLSSRPRMIPATMEIIRGFRTLYGNATTHGGKLVYSIGRGLTSCSGRIA